ncbi:hypothetical protein KP509_1Z197600 [Ceratopteris richardii]|nr:hypothetical protein KP509_1Z197600 [Ceratopteris richardii]
MGGIEPVDFSKKAALLKNGHKVSELFDRTPLLIGKSKKQNPSLQDFAYLAKKNDNERADRVNVLQSTNETNKEDIFLINNSSSIARSRWRRATHSVAFMNHLAASIRSAATDLVEDRTVEEIVQQASEGDAAAFRARTCERLNTAAHTRIKGRKGMESLLVQQNRNLITFLQGLYVACLKMPIGLFLVGVFLAPVLLGLLFTSIYLLDVDGLSFNGIVPEDATTNPLVSAKQRCLAFLNVFLYALSLSTTFGGAPVAAESPFCLLVANINTLLAQFLFVFLSGAGKPICNGMKKTLSNVCLVDLMLKSIVLLLF